MYDLFIGNYQRVMGMGVYHKLGNEYIPCTVTAYTFKSGKYSLSEVGGEGRSFKTTRIYQKINNRD